MMLSAYPNPAEDVVKVAYKLPPGEREGTLVLFNSNGQLVKRYNVDDHTDHLMLDVSGLKSGMYHYYMECGKGKSRAEKLLVR